MESILNIKEGIKCSVIVEINGIFQRLNGIVDGKIQHLNNVWCIRLEQYPYFVKSYEKYFEVLEPMDHHTKLISALDSL
jgi:hypothetical protein